MTARCGCALFIENDARRLVALQLCAPHVVHIGADDVDETPFAVFRCAFDPALLPRLLELADDLLGDKGIDAETK
jgi:hypothetical protein